MLTAAVATGVIIGLVRPGSGTYGRPRGVALVLVAAATQVVAQLFSGWAHVIGVGLSLALGALWLAVQRRHLASGLLVIGSALNLAVITANGGMPVDSAALRVVGRSGVDVTVGFLYKHVPMDSGTRLSWLADRVPVPVQRNVISIGDIVMAVAIVLWIADSVREWRTVRRSTSSVDGEHRGSPCGEVVSSHGGP